jgi:hypothetical protein
MTRSLIIRSARGLTAASLLVVGVLSRPAVAQTPAVMRRPLSGTWPKLTIEPVAPPVPVFADGRLHLVYELRLTSFDSREVRVDRLDVLTAPGSSAHSPAMTRPS